MDELTILLKKRWSNYVCSDPPELDSIDLIYGDGKIIDLGNEEDQIKEIATDELLFFLLKDIFPNLPIYYARIEVYLISPFGNDDIYYEIEVYDSDRKSLRNIGLH